VQSPMGLPPNLWTLRYFHTSIYLPPLALYNLRFPCVLEGPTELGSRHHLLLLLLLLLLLPPPLTPSHLPPPTSPPALVDPHRPPFGSSSRLAAFVRNFEKLTITRLLALLGPFTCYSLPSLRIRYRSGFSRRTSFKAYDVMSNLDMPKSCLLLIRRRLVIVVNCQV
jgi:hypothetical protein